LTHDGVTRKARNIIEARERAKSLAWQEKQRLVPSSAAAYSKEGGRNRRGLKKGRKAGITPRGRNGVWGLQKKSQTTTRKQK